MSNDHFLEHVDDQGEAIDIDRDKHRSLMIQNKSGDVASVLEGVGAGHVGGEVEGVDFVADGA